MVVVAMTGAFENVPRRRRSAGAAGTTGIHGSGASQTASADHGAAEGACKEQPLSSSSRGVAEHVDQAEKQGRDQPEEPPVGQNGSADPRRDVSPAPSSRSDDGAAAPPARSKEPVVPSSSSSAAARVKDAEELRRIKGKMLAQDQSLPEPTSRNNAAAAAPPILGDASRCHGNSTGAAASKPPIRTTKSTTGSSSSGSKKRKDRGGAFWFSMGGEGQSTSSAGSDMDVSLDRIPVASALLRDALSNLGGVVAPPVRVYGKMMTRSDRTTQQARLLLSCKSWRNNDGDAPPFPLDAFMTAEEVREARGAGLHVLAYDRDGATYDGMKLRYLPSNHGYRVIGNWGHFLRGNGLVDTSSAAKGAMDVLVDLWLFRCPKGNLGIVLIHYRRGDAAHADAAFEDEDMVRVRKNSRRREPAAVDQVDSSAAEDDGMEVEDEDAGEDGVAMQDVVMEDIAYDAVTEDKEGRGGGGGGGGQEEASALPSSNSIGVTLVLEVTGSQEEATVPLASSDADNVKAEKEDASAPGKKLAAPSPPQADGANEEDEAAGAQGHPASTSPVNANDDAKVVQVHAARAKVEETAEHGRAAEPVSSSLSGYKQEVIEAAKTLMLISQGFW